MPFNSFLEIRGLAPIGSSKKGKYIYSREHKLCFENDDDTKISGVIKADFPI